MNENGHDTFLPPIQNSDQLAAAFNFLPNDPKLAYKFAAQSQQLINHARQSGMSGPEVGKIVAGIIPVCVANGEVYAGCEEPLPKGSVFEKLNELVSNSPRMSDLDKQNAVIKIAQEAIAQGYDRDEIAAHLELLGVHIIKKEQLPHLQRALSLVEQAMNNPSADTLEAATNAAQELTTVYGMSKDAVEIEIRRKYPNINIARKDRSQNLDHDVTARECNEMQKRWMKTCNELRKQGKNRTVMKIWTGLKDPGTMVYDLEQGNPDPMIRIRANTSYRIMKRIVDSFALA